MAKYASETTVSPEKSLAEIQQVLKRYGATKYLMYDEGTKITIGFEMHRRAVRFTITLPTLVSMQLDPAGRKRSLVQAQAALEKEERQKYRALLLVIKAQLESVESGIETFEQAFLAHLALPGASSQTVGEWLTPQLEKAYSEGSMPLLLSGPTR